MKILFGYVFTYIYIFSILFLIDILKKKFKCSEETSRKLIHILVSLSWIIMFYCFENTWHLMIPPITFVILNYISYKKDLFSMMERKDKSKNSFGTVYYPMSMVVLSICSMVDKRFLLPCGIGMFCMAFGDGLAPYFGQKFKSYAFKLLGNSKTLFGSLTVFICSLIVAIIFSLLFNLNFGISEILLISLCSTIFELIGIKGLDNIILPIGVAIVSYIFIII